jgi:hypothetical protein
VEDVLRKLEEMRGDGQKGKFLQQVTHIFFYFLIFLARGDSQEGKVPKQDNYSRKSSM